MSRTLNEHRFEIEVDADAPPERVFSLLADVEHWKQWAGLMIATSTWERVGVPPPGGVGAIRAVGRFPFIAREEIVEFDPPHHMAYVLRSGMPNRSYRADVHLSPTARGTHIHWSGIFVPSIPGSGRIMTSALRTAVQSLADHLVKAAPGDSQLT